MSQIFIALLCVLSFMGAFLPSHAEASATSALQYLPVQDAGRIKPFDTFAREALELIHGKKTFEGKPAYEIVMTWLLQPQIWNDKPLFEIKHHLLKKALGLPNEAKYLSAEEVFKNDKLPLVLQDLASKREAKAKLDPYFQAVQRLENQLFVFREIAAGRLLKLSPIAGQSGWQDLTQLSEPQQEKFLSVTRIFVQGLSEPDSSSVKEGLEKAVSEFKASLRGENSDFYADESKISAEVFYNGFHPFKWAWSFYIFSVVSLALFWILRNHKFIYGGWAFAVIGLAFHLSGFLLRVYLSERAPVSNMYETVVWVSFGAVLFSMVIEVIYKWRIVLAAGAAVGAFCLVLTDLAPSVLDGSIQPLEPVLRSNYWLTIHVLTITISYAAFFLAFALGDIGLFLTFKNEKKYEERIRAIVMALYRAIQIGVALLGPGIILGGIWADYSWGRFWGWDPKETWALIALLGYLALLHARLAGLIRNFGMICAAIVTFSLVIMAWYGVNFILGAGLHSYGFGAGGVEYVAGFVGIHLLAVIFVSVVRRERQKNNSSRA